jgi:predicted transcriptional regulator
VAGPQFISILEA